MSEEADQVAISVQVYSEYLLCISGPGTTSSDCGCLEIDKTGEAGP